jgi:hypothetical protein
MIHMVSCDEVREAEGVYHLSYVVWTVVHPSLPA